MGNPQITPTVDQLSPLGFIPTCQSEGDEAELGQAVEEIGRGCRHSAYCRVFFEQAAKVCHMLCHFFWGKLVQPVQDENDPTTRKGCGQEMLQARDGERWTDVGDC